MQDQSGELQLTAPIKRPLARPIALAAGFIAAAVTGFGAGYWFASDRPTENRIGEPERQIEGTREMLEEEVEDPGPIIGVQAWGVSKNFWKPAIVPVCWETLEPAHARQRQWVADALKTSWEQNSALKFTEFDQCRKGDPGVHVAMTQGVPVTQGVGIELNGVSNALTLNFDYVSWLPECRQPEAKRESCIRFHAVHEFGHAIGLVHEHNRHDTPTSCQYRMPTNDSRDPPLTPWDPESVMNYCDHGQLDNAGRLSRYDKLAVGIMYPRAI